MKTTLALLSFFCVLFTTKAQDLVRWNFELGGSPTLLPDYSQGGFLVASQVSYSGVFPSGSGFTMGVSSAQGDFASIFRGWPVSSQWDASDYLEFRLSVDTEALLSISSVSLWYKRSLSGPRVLHFRSDKDNYAIPIDSVVIDEIDDDWHVWSFPLDSFVVMGYEQATFRLYGNSAISSTSGTLTLDSVAIHGEVLLPVENPIRVILSGPWNGSDMSDSLRYKGLIPLIDPYGFGKTVLLSALANTGPDAVVDWIEVELRDSLDPSQVIAECAFLLQRDGDVVDVNGTSLPKFYVDTWHYNVSVLHRNHLAVMTAEPVAAGDLVQFSSPLFQTWGGSVAQKSLGSVNGLWPGNVKTSSVGNGIQYTGSGNDRDPILIVVGATTPNAVVPGYLVTDTNLDGVVKYTGSGNDRDVILQSVGGTTPNNVRLEQVP